MLSENAIDNLIQPLIDRQEAINNYVINLIAKRIKEIGGLLPSDVYRLERLLKSGADVRKINKQIATLTGLQAKEIKRIIKVVAQDAYVDVKPYYDYRHLSYIPFEKNAQLQRIVTSIANQTAGTYENLAQAQAFMLRDRKNPKRLIPTGLSQTYYRVVDEAVQAVSTGTIDYNTAMRNTLKELVDSGIRSVDYHTESGRTYSQRLDTALRRNILDGIRAVNQGVQDEVGKQYGADGKEITVHANSAPDHEPVQGHQFTNEEFDKLQNAERFQDINGNQFEPIQRAIGTLNCRHFAYSIIVGFTKPNFTQEQLNEFIRRNNEGYTTKDGKHLTMYECTQFQRKLETMIRRAKDGQIAAKLAGDTKLAMEYQAKINRYQMEYKAFSRGCGLSEKKSKMTVSGYHKISTK